MTITVDAGDSSQGLRRAFGLTGRIPLALDETCVPTGLVRDSSRPPYASEPRYCYCTSLATGDATHFGQQVLENNTFKAGDNAAGVIAVVDSIEISNFEGANRQYQIYLGRRSIQLGLVQLQNAVVGNDDQQGSAANPQAPRCQVFNDPTVGGAPGVFWFNQVINANRMPYKVDTGGGIVLYNNDALTVTVSIAAATINLFTIRWREFIIRAS